MSEPKFTKGPWNNNALSVVDSNNHVIARCYYNWLFSDDDDEVMAQATFNAALVSAAPEMYAILETLQADYEENSVVHGKIAQLLKKARDEE